MNAWQPDTVIYHHPCDDGFAAAWVARRKWPGVELVGSNYGLALPDDVEIAGKHLLIADFSFKPDELRPSQPWPPRWSFSITTRQRRPI